MYPIGTLAIFIGDERDFPCHGIITEKHVDYIVVTWCRPDYRGRETTVFELDNLGEPKYDRGVMYFVENYV